MTLRDNLAAVLEKIREAINAIDAAEAAPAEEPAAVEADVAEAEAAADVAAEDVSAAEAVHEGGPASV